MNQETLVERLCELSDTLAETTRHTVVMLCPAFLLS